MFCVYLKCILMSYLVLILWFFVYFVNVFMCILVCISRFRIPYVFRVYFGCILCVFHCIPLYSRNTTEYNGIHSKYQIGNIYSRNTTEYTEYVKRPKKPRKNGNTTEYTKNTLYRICIPWNTCIPGNTSEYMRIH